MREGAVCTGRALIEGIDFLMPPKTHKETSRAAASFGFSFLFAPFFFLSIFHKKILRQDRLGTTIAQSVDL
jgi:hypothetical protein